MFKFAVAATIAVSAANAWDAATLAEAGASWGAPAAATGAWGDVSATGAGHWD